jgi:hypothetical protein
VQALLEVLEATLLPEVVAVVVVAVQLVVAGGLVVVEVVEGLEFLVAPAILVMVEIQAQAHLTTAFQLLAGQTIQ